MDIDRSELRKREQSLTQDGSSQGDSKPWGKVTNRHLRCSITKVGDAMRDICSAKTWEIR